MTYAFRPSPRQRRCRYFRADEICYFDADAAAEAPASCHAPCRRAAADTNAERLMLPFFMLSMPLMP